MAPPRCLLFNLNLRWLLNYTTLFWLFTSVYSQLITPPPQLNDSPVIANNRIYYLKTFPARCGPPIIDTFPSGTVIRDSRALMKKDNPHNIRGTIHIAPSGCLYIEPGTVLKFAPGQGMIVNGTLIARGSELPGGRITMTKLEGEYLKRPSGDWQNDARLVMGNTTKDGRLDLKYKDRWRAVCTNYNNFSEIDANVTCRHLGFLKGNFTYHSFARNMTDYILWDKPDCKGHENSLFECPGANTMKIGRHICDGQEVIGFQCEGLRPGLALDHWRGIDFYNSTTEARYQISNNYKVYMNESLSFLEYLDISYTGLDTYHGRTSEPNIFYQKAAISASPHVPMINNVTIKYGAYDALNFTEITGPIHIANSTISFNRGYGMFIQSSVGRCLINMTEINNNWGDGIKFYLSNLTIFDFRLKFPQSRSFCNQAQIAGISYPFYEHMDLVQVNGNDRTVATVGGSCERVFVTDAKMKISVHFMIVERDPEATGKFILRDGGQLGRELGQVPIHNGSFPQSVTTRTNSLFIRFEYTKPENLICKKFPPCIRFLLELTTGYDVEEEFQLLMSSVHDNIGYGVNIQDMRSKVRISNETIISANQFGAGVHIYRGAGDIVINGTRIENNADSGINITYSGGFQLINTTQLVANKGYGIVTEYLKLNRTRIESQNKMEIVRSKFMWNEMIGLRIGNYCRGGDILINESYFAYNYDEAIEYLSCNISTMYKTKFRIEFNTFNDNFRHAILMRPLLNTDGIITNNTFANHTLSTLRIDNGYDLLVSRWYRDFPVTFNIFENTFEHNMGRYVLNIRLTQNSAVQTLNCKFNYFQHNEINDSFPFLNPRSRANAVIVLSSSNVQFRRNLIDNPSSVREVATHLVDPSIKIDAKENYWGTEINRQIDYEKVYNSIFDQDDRYNLAQVQYHPALKTVRLYENYLADDVPEYLWEFQRGNVIGGFMEKTFVVGPGKTFYVDKDIYVFPDKTLLLEYKSKLKFKSSVGMVVHGVLRADGMKRDSSLTFDLDDREEFMPVKNRTASVRLMDGFDEFEGRLEVEVNGVWGTVCKDGWIEENSMLVCHQLGLSYNREYPVARIQQMASSEVPILMSWVSCDDADVDLTQCRSVNVDAQTCGHDKDVYIRCQKPTWAGITLPAAYKLDQNQPVQPVSQIRFAEINNAGLFDPDTSTLTPALRIDYNYFDISWLTIQNCVSDGIQVSYNQPYASNKMEYITVLNSTGNGIVTKSPNIEIMHSRFDSNQKAGFLYDPFFTEYDALQIRNTIYSQRRIDMFAQPQRTLMPDQLMFLICAAGERIEKREYVVEVKVSSPLYKLALQVMDYLPVEAVEKVVIYDSDRASISSLNTKRWEIEKDLVDFPILSSSSIITIQLKVNGQLSGRLAFAIFTRSYDSVEPLLKTVITNTTFNRNYQGIVTKHYNNPSNRRLELFHRHKEEQIYFKDVKIYNSFAHAMYMPSVTKFSEDYIPTYEDMTRPERVAKINYTLFRAEFKDNAAGILAEHNHVDFANNVWHWMLSEVNMHGTRRGGIEIELPRVNDETEREVHAISVVDSIFQNNQDFAFKIAGYYAQLKIDKNLFTYNKCQVGLIHVTGLEKNMTINSNAITENNCRYLIDIDIVSHSEYFTTVLGQINLNKITDNIYEYQVLPGSNKTPRTYAIAVRGLQNIKANFNLLGNRNLEYELIAGITSILLGSSVNVTHNYWGVTDQPTIRKRIFDFDDWNNYAIAEYFPYLTLPDLHSIPSAGVREPIYLDPNHLGGRVEKSQILMEIGRPYIVQSDLTVMPGVTLTIPAGTELQFMPNVGILVLGRLVANGLPYNRIKFLPVQPSNNPVNTGRKKRGLLITRKHRRESSTTNVRLRGDGTLFRDAGFLELYNASTKSWNMMCDSQFNEKTAEVVCRQLGKEVINVKVRFTHLYDYYIYGKSMYFRKEFWYNSYFCRGDEDSITQCITRYNYNLLPCVYAANYTFITCGERNLDPKLSYWGNIRFAMDAYEEKPLSADIGIDQSLMSYVDIVGAGVLHGEKVGAVQTTYVTPVFRNINITSCADNGYDIIAPRQNLNIQNQNISGNLGFGVNVLVLNGETSLHDSSFLPHGPSTIPYSVHGLVDICRLEKEIEVETRLILFYKYGPYTRDCVKIIRSRKTVGLRILQINLFHEDFSRNSLDIYDGTVVSKATHIGHIVANSSTEDTQRLFQTTGEVMAVHVHASVSFGTYGFIAEVVKLPLSGLVYPNSEYSHVLQQAEIRKNEDGAIQYKNVGETTPSLFIEHCWLGENGYPILNLTSPPTIDISLQSTISFRFSHNQVSYNHGGMYLSAHASSLNTALRGNITNNVFAFGKHGEALNISGHYFQRLMLYQNYFYNYTAGDYRDVIHIMNVVVNLTHNYILKNVGHYIIHTFSSDDGTDSQIFARNAIYDNNATALRESTIKISHGRPKFVKNFLVNNLNDFEMMTYPKTNAYTQTIDAKDNWWGSERQAYISGKTYDYTDDSHLVEIEFWPPIVDNRSLVEGDCLPGWVYDKKRCYRYMGGAVPFEQAKQFCQSHGAFLAEARDREDFLNYLVRLMVIEHDWSQRVWVMSEVGPGRCSAFEKSYIVYEEDCGRKYYPFICETNPQLDVPEELTSAVKAMIIGISVGVGSLIFIIVGVLIILWCMKSKRRKKERFERTASMRSSLNNLTKINPSLRGTRSTLTGLSVGASRQWLNDFDERSNDSSNDKKSSSSAASDGANRSQHSFHSRSDINQDIKPIPDKMNGKPIHSLRPDRSKLGKKQNMGKSEDTEKMLKEYKRQHEQETRQCQYSRDDYDDDEDDSVERGKLNNDNSDEDSVKKGSFDASTTSEETETSDEEYHHNTVIRNKQQPFKKSSEQLQKPLIPSKSRQEPLIKASPSDSNQTDLPGNKYKSRSLSGFTIDAESAAKNTPIGAGNKEVPKPAPRPKPLPPSRKFASENQDQIQQTKPLLTTKPQLTNVDNNGVYKSKQRQSHKPELNVNLQNKGNQDSQSYNSSDHSLNKYEPVDYNAVPKNTYGIEQKPDADYMPRPLGNPAVGLSRERLDTVSSSNSFNINEPSQSSHSFMPSINVGYTSKQPNPAVNVDPLASYPRADYQARKKSFPSVSSIDDKDSISTSESGSKYLAQKKPLSSISSEDDKSSISTFKSGTDYLSYKKPLSSVSSEDSKDTTSTQLPPYSPLPVPDTRTHIHERQNQIIDGKNNVKQLPHQPLPSFQTTRLQGHDRPQQISGSQERLEQIRGSRDGLNRQTPPLGPISKPARPQSHDKLYQTGGSQDRLDQIKDSRDYPNQQPFSSGSLSKTAKSQSRDRLYQARGSQDRLDQIKGSRDNLNQQPFSSESLSKAAKSQSRDRLYQSRGSQDRLDQVKGSRDGPNQQPLLSGPLSKAARSQSRDRLYQARGSRDKLNQIKGSRDRLDEIKDSRHDPSKQPSSSGSLSKTTQSQSRDRPYQTRGSRDKLNQIRDDTDPLNQQIKKQNSNGEQELKSRHGGSRDILYLSKGTKPNSESTETEI